MSLEIWLEGAILAGDVFPSAPAYSSTIQPLCSDSSRNTASFGRGSLLSQLRGGIRFKGVFVETAKQN